LFELTYDKPTIDGKDAQVKVDAEQDATQKAQQAESVAKDHADQVASDAESNANNYTNAVKLQIDAELLEKAGLEYVNGQLVLKANQSQVDTIESELNGAILDIADKADLAYVDGQLVLKANQSQVDGLVQDIADKADLTYVNGQLTSKADKADTYTITQVDNALNSKVSTTQYTTDINGIVTDLNDHESRITQTETDITSKVSSTQYNQDISALQGDISTLETTVGNHATSINQNASAISLKANATDVYTKTQVDTSLSNKADATTVNAIETRVSEAEAELTVQAGQIASKVSQTEYDADINGVVTRLNSAESSITQNANEISQRVTTTTYNAGMAGKEDTVYKQNSAPAHANGRLWLNTSVTPNILYRSTGSAWVKSTPTTANEVGAYSSSAGNSLASRVTTAESNITQNANAITLKASQSALDSLANDVTSVTNQVSSLQVSVNGITADVSSLESTVNGHTSDISSLNSQLTVQAGQISSKVDATFVTGAIADIEIGGRNLVINSAMNTAWTRWNSNITLQLTSYGTKIAWTSYGQSAMHSPLTTPLVEGEKYVVSFEARGTLNRLQLFIITTTSPNLNFYNSTQDLSETEFRRITVPFTYTTPRESDTLWIGGMPSATGQWLEVKKETVKLDKGNKATDWTPAPEDVQSEIDSVYSYAESEINQLAGQINLKADATTVNNINTRLSSAEVDINALEGAITSKVETSTFNTLKGRVDTAESTITQQATEIDLKVNKNGVISAINLSSEVATINASKINLVGAVTVLSDITGNLGTINAGTINGVNINGSSFKQTGTNGTITLNSNGLIFDGKNSSIEMNIITTSGWEDVSSLVFKDNNGFRAMEIYQHYTDSVLISDRALYVISGDQGLHLDGTAYRNAFNSPGVFVNGGLRVTNDKQALIVRSTNTATNAYDPVNIITPYASTQIGPRNSDYSHFNTSATLGFYFYDPVTIEGDIRLNGAGRVHNSGDGVTYIQGNTSVRATRYLSGTLTPMFASAFNTGSLASTKTDIKKLNINAIDILKNQAELYSYYLKGDIEEGISISKMGFVIGEGYKTPSEVLSADGEAVEGYAHSTLNTKAIKELIGITDDHADRINYLEMENQVLKQRLNQLEGVA
jgi:peptidoglycan hydrolase CwlO-like protein